MARRKQEFIAMISNRANLVRLREKLEMARQCILTDQALTESGRLPAQLIRDLADIEGAAQAVAAEIARHTPKVGYGGET